MAVAVACLTRPDLQKPLGDFCNPHLCVTCFKQWEEGLSSWHSIMVGSESFRLNLVCFLKSICDGRRVGSPRGRGGATPLLNSNQRTGAWREAHLLLPEPTVQWGEPEAVAGILPHWGHVLPLSLLQESYYSSSYTVKKHQEKGS